jgi:tRNA-specific 2-thiouridylase
VKNKKVVVAMSGGVDSSVAAALLKEQGYRVIGVGLKLFDAGAEEGRPRTCCGLRDLDDARRVAQVLSIPFYVLDLEEIFREAVIDYFIDGYLRGETPNPCLACNRVIKFDVLLERCLALGADYLATGHYARVEYDPKRGEFLLLKGMDARKDQSYFLYMLEQEKLSRLLFPLGKMTKELTRRIAAQLSLKVHDKRESQDVCFVGKAGYVDLLAKRGRAEFQPGPILDRRGEVVGSHRGLPLYTLGQRRKLGVSRPGRWYVVDMDPSRNAIIVDGDPHREERVFLREVSYTGAFAPTGELEVMVVTRYRGEEIPAVLVPLEGESAMVKFTSPQKVVAPGQAVVFYREAEVIGGGIAERRLD